MVLSDLVSRVLDGVCGVSEGGQRIRICGGILATVSELVQPVVLASSNPSPYRRYRANNGAQDGKNDEHSSRRGRGAVGIIACYADENETDEHCSAGDYQSDHGPAERTSLA
jgi:hypothetical protein